MPPRTGTLASVALTGGGPREILDDVIAADWSRAATSSRLSAGTGWSFRSGNTIHGRHRFTHVRIAPDGQRLALADGPSIVVLDRSGHKTTLSSGWGDTISLAWSPSGDEVWFTANRRGERRFGLDVARVSLAGKERVIFSSAGTALAILDVFRDGRALIATSRGQDGVLMSPARGGATARALMARWLRAGGALARWRRVLLSEMLRGAGKNGSIYLRKTDGSDAIRLGDGYGEDLSPDGKWVLATPVGTRQHWIIVPTGPGSPRTLPPGPLVARFGGQLSAQRTSDRVRRSGEGSRRAHLCPGHRRRIDSRHLSGECRNERACDS